MLVLSREMNVKTTPLCSPLLEWNTQGGDDLTWIGMIMFLLFPQGNYWLQLPMLGADKIADVLLK